MAFTQVLLMVLKLAGSIITKEINKDLVLSFILPEDFVKNLASAAK